MMARAHAHANSWQKPEEQHWTQSFQGPMVPVRCCKSTPCLQHSWIHPNWLLKLPKARWRNDKISVYFRKPQLSYTHRFNQTAGFSPWHLPIALRLSGCVSVGPKSLPPPDLLLCLPSQSVKVLFRSTAERSLQQQQVASHHVCPPHVGEINLLLGCCGRFW